MRQILVLSAQDFLVLRTGQGLDLTMGGLLVTLTTEAGLAQANGHQPAPEPGPKPRGRRARREWSEQDRQAIRAEVALAAKKGTPTLKSIMDKHGLRRSVLARWGPIPRRPTRTKGGG